MGKIRKIVRTTQIKLLKIVKKKNSVRAGSTVIPKKRAKNYQDDGYSGIMYYAKTSNMKKSENKLLRHKPLHNKQKRSNVGQKRGFTYVINGKKFKMKNNKRKVIKKKLWIY